MVERENRAILLAEIVVSEHLAARPQATLSVERLGRVYDAILSTTPDFAYLFDREGRFLYANKGLLNVWGRKLEDCVGKTCRELGYEQWHHEMHMREIAQVIATKAPIRGEVNFRAKLTGLGGVYDYIFTPVFGPDGEVEVIAGTTRDVTEKAVLTETLEREKENLAEVVEKAPYFILVTRGAEHLVEVANEEYQLLVGRKGFVGKSLKDVIPEVQGQGYFELLDRVYQTGEPFFGNEARVRVGPGGGDERYVNFVYQAIRGVNGKIAGLFTHGVDVTELVRQRERLRLSQEQYRSLFDTMDEGFCVIEVKFDERGKAVDYVFVEMNRAFEGHTGLRNAVGKSIRELAPEHEEF